MQPDGGGALGEMFAVTACGRGYGEAWTSAKALRKAKLYFMLKAGFSESEGS